MRRKKVRISAEQEFIQREPVGHKGKLAQCARCQHTWKIRTSVAPRMCPKCGNWYWNVER